MPASCRLTWPLVLLFAVSASRPILAQPAPGFKVPPGFEVTEYADSKLANDIYTMTLDPKGRIVVAGRGYIRILVDSQGTGHADKALSFAETPKDGAQGLLWEGKTLHVTGDGGLRKFTTTDGDKADGPSHLIRAMKTGREHGAHALRRGPDGWLYLLCGNETGIDATYAELPTSPVTQPVAGCVLRFTPDLKKCEIVAHGFRNPYGMDFSTEGELFTYDSDNERCVSLPWYEPTRFYHVMSGGFYGWLSPQHAQFWRYPPYFVDVVAPALNMGRGSPTGVACYRHAAFPAKYRGGMFAADWTFGKVYHLTLVRAGASYTCKKEVFLEAVGDNGFAPTAIVVHPQTGDLYISIGGRGTRGAVYRVHYTGAPKKIDPAALTAWQIAPRSLDWKPALLETLPHQAEGDDKLERLRALHLMTRHASHFPPIDLINAVRAGWDDPDRSLRQAAAALIAKMPDKAVEKLEKFAKEPHAKIALGLARFGSHPQEVVPQIRNVLVDSKDAAVRLEAIRLIQLTHGDIVAPKMIGQVWEGYSIRTGFLPGQIGLFLGVIESLFPTGHAELDAEMARIFAMLEDDMAFEKVCKKMAATPHPVDQLHYLIVLGRLRTKWSPLARSQIAAALLTLEDRIHEKKLNIDSNWAPRLKELYQGLAKHDPQLNHALMQQAGFGQPAHALFALTPKFNVAAAAPLFLKKARADDKYQWNADVVALIGTLPENESLPVLRPLWGKAGLDAAILPVLAKHPAEEDRAKFLAGLKSPQLALVETSLMALKKLPAKSDDEELLALVTALQRLPKDKAKGLAADLGARLEQLTGQKHGIDRAAWVGWLDKAHPKLSAKLTNIDGVDVAAWKKRFQQLKLDTGDAPRGAAVFQKANCATCHSGGQALGPDLRGVTKRFGPEDLFWAIVQPSKDVPERYQMTLFETHDGKVYQGIIIYQATDGVLLQTGAATTIRLPGDAIASQQPLPNSLMPAGLLDALSDQDIADLFAYLRSLN